MVVIVIYHKPLIHIRYLIHCSSSSIKSPLSIRISVLCLYNYFREQLFVALSISIVVYAIIYCKIFVYLTTVSFVCILIQRRHFNDQICLEGLHKLMDKKYI